MHFTDAPDRGVGLGWETTWQTWKTQLRDPGSGKLTGRQSDGCSGVGRVGRGGMDGRRGLFVRPRTSPEGIGPTLQAVGATSAGFAVYAHVHGDGNDSENKQKGGRIEKRESVGRARDISERFWTTYGKLRSPGVWVEVWGVGWGGCILFNSSH